MKLKDLEPGQCFKTDGSTEIFLALEVHPSTEVVIGTEKLVREYPAVNLKTFQITTWMSDGLRDVELVEDV